MLRCNREHHGDVQLTSGVSLGYTANLRCTPNVLGHPRRYPRSQTSRGVSAGVRSEEHTSELQSHSDLHSFPTRRSSDLCVLRLHCQFALHTQRPRPSTKVPTIANLSRRVRGRFACARYPFASPSEGPLL